MRQGTVALRTLIIDPLCLLWHALEDIKTTWEKLAAFMPRQGHSGLVSLPNVESSYNLLPPIFYRPACPRNRDDRCYPYELKQRHRRTDGGLSAVRKTLEELTEPGLDRHGDLGWTLEYATAHCFKFLNGNRPSIVDTIDTAREAPLCRRTPFLVFNSFDRAMFQGRLKGMVYLKWRTLSDSSSGVTSAPDVRDSRICIELNIRPYEEREADLDDLLGALVHQMIHAYFLVCCGKQIKGTTQDGRLVDAVNFGVLMYTIKEISGDCEDGPLALIFYSHRRARKSIHTHSLSNMSAISSCGAHDTRARPYIAIDPHGDIVGPPLNDGQSHCTHDNRRFCEADVRNWQVLHYASAIDLAMEEKGVIVYDLDVSGELRPVERLRGPPSSTYVELVWDEKRVMVPRNKVMGFESLKKPGKREGKCELYLPKCDVHTLKCLWDFIQHRKYSPQHPHLDAASSQHREDLRGPPIIVHGHGSDPTDGVTVHIRVFKAAETMKFLELQNHAMERLYEMPTTADDPITALKEIYNDNDSDRSKPIHAELHKWARKFLARTDERHNIHTYNPSWGPFACSYPNYSCNGPHGRGTSNYEKLVAIHGDRFQELYHRNPGLKDDSKLVVAQLSYPGHLADNANLGIPLPIDSNVHTPSISTGPSASVEKPPHTPTLARRRSFSDYHDPIDWRFGRARSPSWQPTRATNTLLAPLYPDLPSRSAVLQAALDDVGRPSSPPYYDYFSRRSGRRRRVDVLTGDRYTRSRERWRDLYGLL